MKSYIEPGKETGVCLMGKKVESSWNKYRNLQLQVMQMKSLLWIMHQCYKTDLTENWYYRCKINSDNTGVTVTGATVIVFECKTVIDLECKKIHKIYKLPKLLNSMRDNILTSSNSKSKNNPTNYTYLTSVYTILISRYDFLLFNEYLL